MSNTHDEYRPDIDGLRAIAVSMVVLFHAFPGALSGGFIGVDVFFVISGYLITRLILRAAQAQQLSLRHFYAQRVRRIFPSLLLVLATSLVAGWFCLTATEFEQLGRHAASGAVFVANFMHWREAGYFDNAADTKPLLHLWSLSIEEQFYLFWPLAMLLLQRMPRRALAVLLLVLAASLAYSLRLAWNGDFTGDFYSPLSRFWELLLGGALAFVLLKRPLWGRAWRPAAAVVGLAGLLASGFLLHKSMPFPAHWALLPTVAAALLIFAGMSNPVNTVLLASRPLVFVGLISYPLYLWHWPLLAFSRILAAQTPPWEVRFLLVLLSALLAWLTYRWIERPIRFGHHKRRALVWLSLLAVLVLVCGHTINRQHGFQSRQFSMMAADPASLVVGAARASMQKKCTLDEHRQEVFEWCYTDARRTPPGYAVLGDSKADALVHGLISQSRPDQSWFMVGAITPLLGVDHPRSQVLMAALDRNPQLQVVVWANALRGMFGLDPQTGAITQTVSAEKIDANVALYSQWISHWIKQGKQVVFVVDNPTLADPYDCIRGGLTPFESLNTVLRRRENPACQIAYADHLKGTAAYRQFVAQLQRENPKLIVHDSADQLCDTQAGVCSISRDGLYLYSYGDHVSDHGARLVARALLAKLDAAKP